MKKIFTLAAALLMGSAAFADDFYLYYDAAEGEKDQELVQVSSLQKITFEDGNLVLTKKDGSKSTTAMSSIQRLFFSTQEAVNIDAVPSEQPTAAQGIYDLSGRKLNVDASALSKGVYIINGEKVQIK